MTIRRATVSKKNTGHVEADTERLLAYVHSGARVTAVRSRAIDVVDPARGHVVPIIWRTDGVWLFNLGDAYYVEHHGWAFDDDFVSHVVERDYVPPVEVDRRIIQEAFEVLGLRR